MAAIPRSPGVHPLEQGCGRPERLNGNKKEPQALGLGFISRTAIRGVRGEAARLYVEITRAVPFGSWQSGAFLKLFRRALWAVAALSRRFAPMLPGSGNHRELRVGAVFIRCPITGLPVPAGMETEPGELRRPPACVPGPTVAASRSALPSELRNQEHAGKLMILVPFTTRTSRPDCPEGLRGIRVRALADARKTCPGCGKDHRWTAKMAWLLERGACSA